MGGGDGPVDVLAGALGHLVDDLTGCRVLDLRRSPLRRCLPPAVDPETPTHRSPPRSEADGIYPWGGSPAAPGGAESGPAPLPGTIAAVTALAHIGSGKVRDIYRVDDDRLLIVASDRISAFDVVNEVPIPEKGRVLTGLSLFWFELLDTPHHLISADPSAVPGLGAAEAASLAGRMMLVRRAEVIPMECVVRGYLYGSSWKEYSSGGGPTTEHLPSGLEMASQLPEPIFTPATKASQGHDENLTEAAARNLVGSERYDELRLRSIDLYLRGAEHAARRGIILADTKFEFGIVDGDVILIDEVLTPDSSRYWP
ncbi:MAG: phosphoribosylaminoimidazolesuccinocarboxamide synthase, partial [Actinobacteria bacterium]